MEGARLNMTVAQSPIKSVWMEFEFQSETKFGTESFFDVASPTRLTIPSSLVGEPYEVFFSTKTGEGTYYTMDGNGLLYDKDAIQVAGLLYVDQPYHPCNGRTGIREVRSGGEYFYCNYYANNIPGVVLTDECHMSVIMDPVSNLKGLVKARQAVSQDYNGNPTLLFTTPDIDTLSTHDGTTGFTVPDGVTCAVVSKNSWATEYDLSYELYRIALDGVTVSSTFKRNQGRPASSDPIFLLCEPGEVITCSIDHDSDASDETKTYINIEWY